MNAEIILEVVTKTLVGTMSFPDGSRNKSRMTMKRLTVVLLVFLSGLSALAELQSADTRESLRGLSSAT